MTEALPTVAERMRLHREQRLCILLHVTDIDAPSRRTASALMPMRFGCSFGPHLLGNGA